MAKDLLDEHRVLFLGNCLDRMKEIPDNSIDMVLCDLPYGTTQNRWDSVIPFESLWKEYHRVVKANGAVVLFGSEPFSSALRLSNLSNYKYDWIWDKKIPTGFLNAKKQPMRYTELVSVFYDKQCTYNPQFSEGKPMNSVYKGAGSSENYGVYATTTTPPENLNTTKRYPSNIISINALPNNSKERVGHPTQKPVALLEYLVKTYTHEGQTVLDNTMGSGSTGVACVNTKRRFVGIEMDEKYFSLAKNRIDATILSLYQRY